MPASQSMSALDSLRTVEFRQTLRGYHIDDVDEYLERVALEAEALQEQLRQAGERMRQATEHISQLEQGQPQRPPAAASAGTTATEETLQRTLLLAQKFVDQTHAEAEAQARAMLEEADERARTVVREAEAKAREMADQSEGRLREEVARLESLRTRLAGDVDTISRHLEAERSRLRGVLGEMLHWIEEHVQPAASLAGGSSGTTDAAPATGGGSSPAAESPERAVSASDVASPERAVSATPPRQGLLSVGRSPNLPNGTR